MRRNNPASLVAMIMVFAIIIILILFNTWLTSEVSDIEGFNRSRYETKEVKSEDSIVYKKKNKKSSYCLGEKVLRKSRLHPNREFIENIIFCGDDEITRFNSKNELIYDMDGAIPDGKVEFVNESKKTYGEEYFFSNKRHGGYKEFYETGEVRKESQYFYGKIVSNKVYFIDGKLRMEQDFSDALEVTGEKEVGVGKIFYRQGGLMYEWNLTHQLEGGYKKSYNVDGKLAEEKRYNELGELLEIIRPVTE